MGRRGPLVQPPGVSHADDAGCHPPATLWAEARLPSSTPKDAYCRWIREVQTGRPAEQVQACPQDEGQAGFQLATEDVSSLAFSSFSLVGSTRSTRLGDLT